MNPRDLQNVFGEIAVADYSPFFQLDGVNGLPPTSVAEYYSASGGGISADAGNIVASTGTSVGGYGVFRSKRPVRYRPGQVSDFLFTTKFSPDSRLANSLQAAGAFNSVDAFWCGYNGANDFGVCHRTGGAHELQTLTVTVKAAGSETVTLILNDVEYSIPVTLQASIAINCREIVTWLAANQSVWEAYQIGNTVVLFALNPAVMGGAFSVASTGAFAGSLTQNQVGVANIETWSYRNSADPRWKNRLGEFTESDFANGIPFKLEVPYLGYGNVSFKYQRPWDGKVIEFYNWAFSGSRTTPTQSNPALKCGVIAASLGSSGTDLSVATASISGGVRGSLGPIGEPFGYENSLSLTSGSENILFSLRCGSVFNGRVNLREIFPRLFYFSPEGSKAVTIRVYINATLTDPLWSYRQEGVSFAETDISATGFTGGRNIGSFIAGPGNSTPFDFTKIGRTGRDNVVLERGDVLTITYEIASTGPDANYSLTWLED